MLGVWVIYRGGGTLESMRALSKVTGLHKNSTGFIFASLLAMNLATEDIGDKIERIFSRLLSVFYVIVIMFTFSRQGYITAGLLLTVYAIRKGWKHTLCLILGGLLFWSFFMPVEVKRRIYYGTDKGFFMGLSESTLGDFTAGREEAWEASASPIVENLFFGRGRYAYKRIIWADKPHLPPHPHNAYIQILLDSGVFGAFFFVGFYILLMAKAIGMALNKNKFISSYGYGYFLCVFVYFLQAYTGFRFYPNEESYYIWLFLGVIMWIDQHRKQIQEIDD
jgi:O-antigen ligase